MNAKYSGGEPLKEIEYMTDGSTTNSTSAAKNVIAAVEENFAIELTDKCETDKQWFAVVNFGLPTLLNEPKLLMECITRRACRKQREVGIPSKCVADFAAEIIGCLNLRFEVSR